MSESDSDEMLNTEMAGALCYLLGFVTGIVLLRMDAYQRNRFVRFHAWQSIFLSVFTLVLYTIFLLLFGIIPLNVVSILMFAMLGATLLLVTVWFIVAYRAVLGRKWKLPIIGKFATRLA